MLENASAEMGSILHVPPHGPCGAFGAGQPCHSARVHEIRWINEVWLVFFEESMVLGSCARCAGMLPFWFICVVYVWRWLCGLVLCIQTTVV